MKRKFEMFISFSKRKAAQLQWGSTLVQYSTLNFNLQILYMNSVYFSPKKLYSVLSLL